MRSRSLLIALAAVAAMLSSAMASLDIELRLSQADAEQPGQLLHPGGDEPLDLLLRADFACEDADGAATLFVSVADTAVSTDGARSPQRIRLRIAGEQLAGLRRSAHCEREGPRLLRQALTAYGTLSCRSDSGRLQTRTVSLPLDVWYDCPGADGRERPDESALRDP